MGAEAEFSRRKDPPDDAELILKVVRRLVAEVHPRSAAARVTLGSDFERDLGLGSLEMAELLVRVEDAFGVELPPRLLGTAATPRDLLWATRSAMSRGRRAGEGGHAPLDAVSPTPEQAAGEVSVPWRAATLIEVLRWHARTVPDRIHIRIVGEQNTPETGAESGRGTDGETGNEARAGTGAGTLTYRELLEEAERVASWLRAGGLGFGEAVAIMLPTCREYFTTFTGVLLAGGVPVPIYPPARPSQLGDHLRRHAGILANARAVMLVTVPEAVGLGRALRAQVESLRQVTVPREPAARDEAPPEPLPAVSGEDLALLQYTSGSTGDPKGVVLTHAALLANIRAMGRAMEASPADVFVSWLPLYHDMGLIGAWLGPMFFGVPLVVMPPQAFLTRPARWLRTVHDHRATISAGPNFAYELCLRRIDDAELEGVDLSSWRLAFNGAEPVGPDTIERFAARFGRFGFRSEAVTPVYGLAETSVGLTFPPLGRGFVIDRVDRDRFQRSGEAVPVPGPAPGRTGEAGERDAVDLRFVGCGRPLPGHQVRVVDATGGEAPDRREGHIRFRGPSATSGYLRNPSATRALFHGDWLDTGDLGYVADGELYVTGRVKDIVIRGGRNLHPDELEQAVGDVPGVRKGCVAAFAVSDTRTGTERLVVLAETRHTDRTDREHLSAEITRLAVDLLGAPPDEIVLAPPRTVPKTSSGKIRRAASRDLYRRGMVGTRTPPPWRQVARFALGGIAPWLRRTRRDLAAAAFAGYAWLLLVVVGLPLLTLLAVTPGQRRRGRLARAAGRTLLCLTGTRVTVHGTEHLPQGPWLAVANHASWLDGPVLATVLPPSCRFVAGEAMARQLFAGFVLRRVGTFFVERLQWRQGVLDTGQLVTAARTGEQLVIFPEGRLAAETGLRPFHMGAFLIAARAQIPVVPIAITGTRSILRPDHHFLRHGAIEVAVNAPLRPEGSDWAAAAELERATRSSILARCGEPDLE